eukprot:m.4964 g.4964  ORF g.4964 m.4964 type:complete len:225 (+) comp11748_c0_seq2:98-772(+)
MLAKLKMNQGILWVSVLFTCAFIYYYVSLDDFGNYRIETTTICQRTQDELDSLVKHVHIVDEVLNKLGIPHYLVYGSMWGALRHAGPLPWDTDADFGVEGDVMCKFSVDQIADAFKVYGLSVDWNSKFGRYRVFYDGYEGVDLIVWQEYWRDGWMMRQAWESWFFFVNYWYHHSFPARLVKAPLPKMMFGGRNISVSHGGIEIQKYLFSLDWYQKPVKPRGCKS